MSHTPVIFTPGSCRRRRRWPRALPTQPMKPTRTRRSCCSGAAVIPAAVLIFLALLLSLRYLRCLLRRLWSAQDTACGALLAPRGERQRGQPHQREDRGGEHVGASGIVEVQIIRPHGVEEPA